jgi:Transglutaminase-like superfamily
MTLRFAGLIVRSLYDMLLYDLAMRVFGFEHLQKNLIRQPTSPRQPDPRLVALVCEAVNLGAAFYVKPVRCLQKSVVTVRLLRRCGVYGRVVIGCRQSPFFSHAWVEVGDRVVNDSPAYKDQLKVLSKL